MEMERATETETETETETDRDRDRGRDRDRDRQTNRHSPAHTYTNKFIHVGTRIGQDVYVHKRADISNILCS